jgi:NDP-sugar pyrophosphorylase family protein
MINSDRDSQNNKKLAGITTALLLAAGTGTRLQPLTLDAPKCLTEVGGIPILGRLLDHLQAKGFKRLIVVLGHHADHIRDFLEQNAGDIQVDYVFSREYQTTNNLVSLWVARELITEPFLLVESDLVFESHMLDGMLEPDRMAVSRILPWMNGTTVEMGSGNRVRAFHMSRELREAGDRYKTVNIYSLSLGSWIKVLKRLDQYVSEGKLGDYYEAAFADLVADGTLEFDAVFFDEDRWYEIDTTMDLHEAEKLYSQREQVSQRQIPGSEVESAEQIG